VIWPFSPRDFDPEVSNETLYADPKGFDTHFNEDNDKWCINGGFSKMIGDYSGKDIFTFRFAFVLKDYASCVPSGQEATIVKFNGA
jgi:hypothetical protein